MITVEGEIEMLQYGIIPNNKTVGYVKHICISGGFLLFKAHFTCIFMNI